ncbi:MAG TPA: DUF2125 domain-containing protein [Alphaproteobacteria bacterium]|nr:DUF2125 domain-containing protein [Alphaproteobacteria bacterium]
MKPKPTGSSQPNFRTGPIRKKPLLIAGTVVVFILYSGWWVLTARTITSSANSWITTEQAKGAKLAPDAVSVGGYPFTFTIKLQNVGLSWPSGLGFTAQNLKVNARPWAIRTFHINATGGVTVSLPSGDVRPALTFASQTLRGTAGFQDNAVPTALNLAADTVSASLTGVEGDAGRELTIATLKLQEIRPATPPKADTDTAMDLSLEGLDLSAPVIEGNPLGSTIKKIGLHVQLMGVPPATYDGVGLKAWRDAGGTINTPDLSIEWGALSFGGNGTLALDTNMQPEGAFSVHIAGYEQALDSLAAAGWIKMSGASLAKLAMGIAAQTGPDGRPTVKTPLTIQDRHISLGPAKLGQIPEIKLD